MISKDDIDAFEYEVQEDMGFPDPTYERDMWMMNATPQDMLGEFIKSFKQGTTNPNLGAALIQEEFFEWLDSFENGDTLNELKELADLVYVCFWRADRMGWDLMEAVRRVHESNMSKLGIDGQPIYNIGGKVMKGPNYKEPNLEDLV